MNVANSARTHGFQYAHWDFDGDDILYVVREASGEHTNVYHDGTYLTLYKINDYARLVKENFDKLDFYPKGRI